MSTTLQKLINQLPLSEPESYALFATLDTLPIAQQAALLALFATKGVIVAELLGASAFLRTHSLQIPLINNDIVDLVGTGGDGIGTFNISTAASLVVASCGVPVAKHGGKSATSTTGSADVMAQLGIAYSHPTTVHRDLTQEGYAYLFAPTFNTHLKNYSALRKTLSFPTIFNILGPLLNPLRPKRQVIGVYHPSLLRPVAEYLLATGSIHALVVHSEEGLDELSISAPTKIIELQAGHLRQYSLTPETVGLNSAPLHTVLGGTPAENAHIIEKILMGALIGPPRDIVLLNSAAGLLVANKVSTLKAGVLLANEALRSGRTLALVQQLKKRAPYA